MHNHLNKLIRLKLNFSLVSFRDVKPVMSELVFFKNDTLETLIIKKKWFKVSIESGFISRSNRFRIVLDINMDMSNFFTDKFK